MNYRHAFHAGNFADVLKHAVLALVIEHMKRKPGPFRVIDTHAGRGLYRLDADAAERTGEWRHGIGRLCGPDAVAPPADIADLLAPYLGAVGCRDHGGAPTLYPGSPGVALALLRPQDRLIASELHPDDAAALREAVGRDARAKVLEMDGWQALRATLPPKERRGVVLVDPPFEAPGELERLTAGLAAAARRFATGTTMLWFPIKDRAPIERFYRDVTATGLAKLLVVELAVSETTTAGPLVACGLVIHNPPFTLAGQLERLAPFLAERLAQGPGAASRVAWLAGEAAGG